MERRVVKIVDIDGTDEPKGERLAPGKYRIVVQQVPYWRLTIERQGEDAMGIPVWKATKDEYSRTREVILAAAFVQLLKEKA